MLESQSAVKYNNTNFDFSSQFSINKNESAILYVFNPRRIPTQVIRPYTYNFTDQLINDLTNDHDMRVACGPSGLKYQSIQNAIIPDTQGVRMNTNTYEAYWSFALFITTAPSMSYSKASTAGPGRQIIAAGYFIGEPPINTKTLGFTSPTPCEDALMIFTHTSLLYDNPAIVSPIGGNLNPVSVNGDDDNVSQMAAGMASEDIFLVDPSSIMQFSQQISPSERMVTPGSSAVCNLIDKGVAIPSRLKSPKHHLKEIVFGVDSAIEATSRAAITSPISDESNYYKSDPMDQFQATFAQNIRSTHRHSSFGVDTTRPVTLGHLGTIYPNLTMIPVITPNESQWEVRPQDMITPSVVYSSMATATINTLAMNSNLAEICFRYNSWMGGGALSNSKGVWEIQRIATILGGSQHAVESAFQTFKGFLETDLFPILQAVRGEFDIFVKYDTVHETLVDLHFLDDYNQETGFTETNNRLSGLLTPSIGPLRTVENNASQLQLFLDKMSCKSGGVMNFQNQNQGLPSQAMDFSFSPHQPNYNFNPQPVMPFN